MNSISNILVAIIVLLSYTSCYAQIKNQQIETVKIYGNCGMCKSTIEMAGNMKNQATIEWNKESNMATISYDSLKTSKAHILKQIALAGYDNDMFLAPPDTYASLPSCCQYERAEKTRTIIDESIMEMETEDHTTHSNTTAEVPETKPLSAVFNHYFALKDALVNTDGAVASSHAKALLTAINEVEMKNLSIDVHMAWMKNLEHLKIDTQKIADTEEPNKQRQYFSSLSKNLYEVIKISEQETPTYYQFCPMANDGKGANWLSKEETIKNPYYGSQMLSCGKTVETIK